MDNSSKILDTYWHEKKSIEKTIDEYKKKLEYHKSNEFLVSYYNNEIEMLQDEINRINRLTREILKAKVQQDREDKMHRREKKNAKTNGKNGIAKTLFKKTRAKLYGLLAALGISVGLIGGTTVKYLNEAQDKQQNQSDTETETNVDDLEIISDDGIITIYGDKNAQDKQTEPQVEPIIENDVVQDEQSEIQEETEIVQEKNEINNNTKINETKQEKDVRVSGYATVRLGANLYDDPFDAVKVQLQKEPNSNIVVKSIGENRVYKVTHEGLYCPDGTFISITEGDLKSAMEQKGMDTSILENIDTEELEKQGYKRMLHVVAEGIAQWVEEGDTLQVDRLGNRIEKTSTEKAQDDMIRNKQLNQSKTQDIEEVK